MTTYAYQSMNSDGKKIGELSYQPGGPKAFIAALEKLKK